MTSDDDRRDGRQAGNPWTEAKLRALDLEGHQFGLADQVDALVPDGRPHRALWDAVATAILLDPLTRAGWSRAPATAELLAAAGVALARVRANEPAPDALF